MPLPEISPFQERIIGPKELETGLTLQYTSPGQRTITQIYLTSDSNSRTVNIYIVPVGATAVNSNKLLDTYSVLANDLRVIPDLAYPIRVGEMVYTSTSGSGLKCTIVASLNYR
jgi:hypothetical protein